MVLGAQSQDGSGWKGPYSPSCSTPCHGQGHPPLDRLLQNLTLTRLPQLEEHHCKGLGLLRAMTLLCVAQRAQQCCCGAHGLMGWHPAPVHASRSGAWKAFLEAQILMASVHVSWRSKQAAVPPDFSFFL